MTLSVSFILADARWQVLLRKERAFFRILMRRALASSHWPQRRYAVSVLLTDDAEIRLLNRRWRNKDKPTNVLSFPLLETQDDLTDTIEPVMLGDIVLAYETIRAEWRASAKTLRNHTAHLLIHGMLHLLGHDHMTDNDAAGMEALETALLRSAGIKNPYT